MAVKLKKQENENMRENEKGGKIKQNGGKLNKTADNIIVF